MNDTAVTVMPNRDLQLHADPEQVLEAASRAAKALQRVVANKPKPVIINGEQYLEYEDWQTLAQFYSYTAHSTETKPVEINGVSGAYAHAVVIDFRTGEVVGAADAYCMADEDRWAGRPWFQLASMAQTRACAKALRNRLAWVAVLAGYRPTPAEEMTDVPTSKPAGKQQQEHWCPIHNVAFREFKKDDRRWYSHKADDGWCNEDKLPKAEPEPAKPNGKPEPQVAPTPPPTTASTGEWLEWDALVDEARADTLGIWDNVQVSLERRNIQFDKELRPQVDPAQRAKLTASLEQTVRKAKEKQAGYAAQWEPLRERAKRLDIGTEPFPWHGSLAEMQRIFEALDEMVSRAENERFQNETGQEGLPL